MTLRQLFLNSFIERFPSLIWNCGCLIQLFFYSCFEHIFSVHPTNKNIAQHKIITHFGDIFKCATTIIRKWGEWKLSLSSCFVIEIPVWLYLRCTYLFAIPPSTLVTSEWRLYPKSCFVTEIPVSWLFMAKKLRSTRWGINFKTKINLSIVASWRYGILIRKTEIFNREGLIFKLFCRAWVGENCGWFDII